MFSLLIISYSSFRWYYPDQVLWYNLSPAVNPQFSLLPTDRHPFILFFFYFFSAEFSSASSPSSIRFIVSSAHIFPLWNSCADPPAERFCNMPLFFPHRGKAGMFPPNQAFGGLHSSGSRLRGHLSSLWRCRPAYAAIAPIFVIFSTACFSLTFLNKQGCLLSSASILISRRFASLRQY